jgi:hypothetical protein
MSDVTSVKSSLSGIQAIGVPEAVGAALSTALKLKWRMGSLAHKVIVTTDAPPHGIGDPNDRESSFY